MTGDSHCSDRSFKPRDRGPVESTGLSLAAPPAGTKSLIELRGLAGSPSGPQFSTATYTISYDGTNFSDAGKQAISTTTRAGGLQFLGTQDIITIGGAAIDIFVNKGDVSNDIRWDIYYRRTDWTP